MELINKQLLLENLISNATKAGLCQSDLAFILGLDRQYLCKICRNRQKNIIPDVHVDRFVELNNFIENLLETGFLLTRKITDTTRYVFLNRKTKVLQSLRDAFQAHLLKIAN